MRKKTVIIIMCIAILFMIVGYAAFSANLNINGTANIASTWQVLFTKIEEVSKSSGVTIKSAPTASGTTATFNLDVQFPGDTIVYKITVENQGTIDAIINDITASKTGNDAIKFNITGIKKGDILTKGTSTTFNVEITYDINTTKQPTDLNEVLTMEINYIQYVGQDIPSEDIVIKQSRLGLRILKDNTAQPDTNIDFSQISSDTNGKGLYYTSTNTEGNKTTYYFRGNVQNNYVSFASSQSATCTYNGSSVIYVELSSGSFRDVTSEQECLSSNICALNGQYGVGAGATESICTSMGGTWLDGKANYTITSIPTLWRIIRINEDGSIRIIKENKIGDSAFNEFSKADNAYWGYMYGNVGSSTYEETHKNTNSSAIKIALDAWYQSNLSSYSSIIADSGFCGDRSVIVGTGIGNDITKYGAYGRLVTNKTPQFKCPQSNDLYTAPTSAKGNKALTYPIGLITADEVAYAGAVASIQNKNYYLFNSEDYWTISPLGYELFGGISGVSKSGYFISDDSDLIFTLDGSSSFGIRPVINLKSTVEITSGDGTFNNPYVIKTN